MQNHVSSDDRRAMNELLADAAEKGWKVLDRYTAFDGWMMGNVCEFVVLRKGRGVSAELAHVHLSGWTKKAHLMRQCESGGSASWEPK
tara:strand:- start:838 stop:1101 length:264 start_codon:yes stop_codon:yes gene_type:complete